MDMPYVLFWLIVTIMMAVVELATMGLLTIWFAIGAAVTMVISLLDIPFMVQVAIFLLVSVLTMLFIRPWAASHLNNKIKKTNIDALVGKRTIAKTDIDNLHGTGKVDIDGSTWIAVSSFDDIVIKEGEKVVVTEVHGAKLIVEREEK